MQLLSTLEWEELPLLVALVLTSEEEELAPLAATSEWEELPLFWVTVVVAETMEELALLYVTVAVAATVEESEKFYVVGLTPHQMNCWSYLQALCSAWATERNHPLLIQASWNLSLRGNPCQSYDTAFAQSPCRSWRILVVSGDR